MTAEVAVTEWTYLINTIILLAILGSIIGSISVAIWYFLREPGTQKTSKKNSTLNGKYRCDVCGALNINPVPKYHTLPFDGEKPCPTCKKAEKIVKLDDLRVVTEKARILPEEECLVRSINFQQGTGRTWSADIGNPKKNNSGSSQASRQSIIPKFYRYYDVWNNETKRVERKELPDYMTDEEVRKWLEYKETNTIWESPNFINRARLAHRRLSDIGVSSDMP